MEQRKTEDFDIEIGILRNKLGEKLSEELFSGENGVAFYSFVKSISEKQNLESERLNQRIAEMKIKIKEISDDFSKYSSLVREISKHVQVMLNAAEKNNKNKKEVLTLAAKIIEATKKESKQEPQEKKPSQYPENFFLT